MNLKIRSSFFLLGLTNLLPVIGVYFWSWDVMDILFLYWAETGIFAFFSLLKISFARDNDKGARFIIAKIMRVIGIPLFIIYYGGFIAGIGAVLYYVNKDVLQKQIEFYDLVYSTGLVLLSFFISYGYSFFAEYLIKEKRNITKENDPTSELYCRILILFFAVSFGIGFTIFLGAPIYLLISLVFFKISVDLFVNYIKEEKFLDRIVPGLTGIFKRLEKKGDWKDNKKS